MYEESIINNEKFWSKQAKRIDWFKDFTKIKNVKYSKDEVLLIGLKMKLNVS